MNEDINKKDLKDIKIAFDKTFKANTKLKRRRRNSQYKRRELFVNTINQYEDQLRKSADLHSSFQLDLNKWEEPFYDIIDQTLKLGFGEKVYELIAFYLYDRVSPDGLINPLVLDLNIPPIFLESPDQLYTLITKLYPESI